MAFFLAAFFAVFLAFFLAFFAIDHLLLRGNTDRPTRRDSRIANHNIDPIGSN